MTARRSIIAAVSFALALTVAAPAAAQHEGHDVGSVHFPTSCSEAVTPTFDRGMALLHSFWFPEAIQTFEAVLKDDPSCAIASWGIALARWGNPLGRGRPQPTLEAGRKAADRAIAIGAKTERERDYIAAVAELYKDYETVGDLVRATNYEKAMERISKKYTDDTEATIFYAMALNATQPLDKTYANQLKAGRLLEPLFEKQPGHPGIAHYIIHAYDAPPLAQQGLDAARRYAKIAPAVPHALHMPSHTFTRLGYWQESIDTNRASADAARKANSAGEELHAFDYQVYAFLQTAQDKAAREVLAAAERVREKIAADQVYRGAGGYALAAIPARWTLERGDWSGAAALTVHPSGTAYVDAITHFARALGAARLGTDLAAARADIQKIAGIEKSLRDAGDDYWATATAIQERAAEAWTLKAEGKTDAALAAMREAADLEDTIEKSAVSPGPISPARELYAEMLLELGRPTEALEQFELSARKEPNRFRGVFGAAKAAQRAGNAAAAKTHFTRLVEICERGDSPGRPELEEARRRMGSTQ